MRIDRRQMLSAASGAIAGGAATAVQGASLQTKPARDFPTVSLAGDDVPRSAADTASRLARLVAAASPVADSYLQHGAVARLEQRFASLLGKSACAFFPTGTMANTVAVRVLCGEGRRALCIADSHLARDESDAVERTAGINLIQLAPGKVAPDMAELAAAFDRTEYGPYPLKVGAVALESPVRRLDGAMVPPEQVRDIAAFARSKGARLHLDGARLLLAPPSIDISGYAASFDTVYVSLYKYLGAPFGAILAGPTDVIERAREYRHLQGGLIAQGWMPALLALNELERFLGEMARAHSAADALMTILERTGQIRRIAAKAPSNIHHLAMHRDLADRAVERGNLSGIRMADWHDGQWTLTVNRSILRQSVATYVALFGS